jgi:hypothetical protein
MQEFINKNEEFEKPHMRILKTTNEEIEKPQMKILKSHK